ncbi:M56 family metallopeptidase [Mucilaginibacter ginsenosidivorans]|uniref:M56 family metallopeptidase n=2 Tax=Mucilaginibacter ginsenosidivorans TaxID=398053 RepID=A0A5B8V0S3_9SPHI|nr:M56 family metallopeptidase [Mucilaginibacter ginsenosidivorans]QEC64852.1 M56 family metallopeptidase [Mucilaginibacter ginsenosidivorans]
MAIYLSVVLCLLLNLGIKIYKLIRLSRHQSASKLNDLTLVKTDDEKGAFSFFNYLFIGSGLASSETVVAHEMVHVRQKHSWDIVYFELISIINWFNPVAYLLQFSIKELHEYIADDAVAGSTVSIDSYTEFLVNNAYGLPGNQLTNNLFNKSLLKKRIMMLHQKRSGSPARLKYLLMLPLTAGCIAVSTLAFAKTYECVDIAPAKAATQGTDALDRSAGDNLKRLKVTQGTISAITDKVSIKEGKDKTGIYNVQNLTNADAARLLKNYNIKIEIVNSYDTGSYPEIKFPITVKPDDGNKIPVLSKGSIGFMIDPGNYTYKTLSDMASKFRQRGYKMDFVDHKSGNESLLQISLRKLDATPGAGTTTTFKIDELIRSGRIIFVGADDTKKLLYVNSPKITFPKPGTLKSLSKKPDTAVRQKINTTIKGKIDSIVGGNHARIKGQIKSQIDEQIQQPANKLPPPSVFFSGGRTLYTYLGRHLRYPTKYFDQKIVGNVIVEFTTGADRKISGVKIKNNAMPLFADEVNRQMNAYTDTVNRAPGTYFFIIQFNLINEKHTRTWLPSGEYLALTANKDCAGNVEIVGFVKDE